MSAQIVLAQVQLPPPVLATTPRHVSSREMISLARASAQAAGQMRRRPLPPPAPERRRRPIELAMLAAGQAGFLGAAVAGVAVMIAG